MFISRKEGNIKYAFFINQKWYQKNKTLNTKELYLAAQMDKCSGFSLDYDDTKTNINLAM